MTPQQETGTVAAAVRLVNGAVAVLSVVLVVASVAWAADLYRPLGLVLFTEQFVAGILGVALLLLFLAVPARKGGARTVPPWYDVLAGLVGLAACGFIAVAYPEISVQLFDRPPEGVTAAIVVLVLVIEGLRRTVGWPLVIVALAFIAYGLFGDLMPGRFAGRASDIDRLAFYLMFDTNALIGKPLIIASTIVVAFVLFGNLLGVTGGSVFFTDLSLALMGRYRGGSAKIAVTGSALFGSISGSPVSNVVSTGVITIPMMKEAGYPAHQAGAIEAVASTGGSLMPPVMGAAAFLIAEFLQISYVDVVKAALLPAILYYAALLIVCDLEAARGGITRVAEDLIPRALPVLRAGWHFAIPFAVLIFALFFRNERAETAALYASLALLASSMAFGYKGARPALRDVGACLRKTGLAVLDIIMICCAAGMVMGVLAVSGLGFSLTLSLVQVAASSMFLLLALSAVVCIVLGMGMPIVGVYVLLAALVAPAMVEVGIVPIAAHLFVMYFGMMSMITPPVAIAAFAAASLAKADPVKTGFAAMRFGWTAYIIPFLFVYSPTLILIGEPGPITLAVATAIAGVWFVSAATVGYATRGLPSWERLLFGAVGLALLMPAGLFDGAIYLDIAGIAGGTVLFWREITLSRRMRRMPARG